MQPEPVPRSSDAPHARRIDPRREAGVDQFGERRTRHDHALVDFELEPGEPHAAHQVGGRDSSLDALGEQLQRPLDLGLPGATRVCGGRLRRDRDRARERRAPPHRRVASAVP